MKKVFNILLIMAFTLLFVSGAVWDYDVVQWNSGDDYSDTLLTTNSDTSDAFDLSFSERVSRGRQDQYPEEISILLWATEGANSDSTKVTWALDLSNDQTYWYSYGTLATQTSTTGDTATTSVTNISLSTDTLLLKYGRLRATLAVAAGDTLTIGAQVSKLYKE